MLQRQGYLDSCLNLGVRDIALRAIRMWGQAVQFERCDAELQFVLSQAEQINGFRRDHRGSLNQAVVDGRRIGGFACLEVWYKSHYMRLVMLSFERWLCTSITLRQLRKSRQATENELAYRDAVEKQHGEECAAEALVGEAFLR